MTILEIVLSVVIFALLALLVRSVMLHQQAKQMLSEYRLENYKMKDANNNLRNMLASKILPSMNDSSATLDTVTDVLEAFLDSRSKTPPADL